MLHAVHEYNHPSLCLQQSRALSLLVIAIHVRNTQARTVDSFGGQVGGMLVSEDQDVEDFVREKIEKDRWTHVHVSRFLQN
jgi:hypothetical protein